MKNILVNMGKIEAIIFDWGGVLIEDPTPAMVKYCAKALGVSEKTYQHTSKMYMDDFQTGKVTEREFWLNITRRLNAPMPSGGRLWQEAFAAAYAPRTELFLIASRLRNAGCPAASAASCKIALLSNAEIPAVEFFKKQTRSAATRLLARSRLRRTGPLRKYAVFDVMVFSCLEGIAKPQREIYELTLARLGTTAKQSLFVDDKPEHVDGARQAGLKAILFNSVEQFKNDLLMFCPGIR